MCDCFRTLVPFLSHNHGKVASFVAQKLQPFSQTYVVYVRYWVLRFQSSNLSLLFILILSRVCFHVYPLLLNVLYSQSLSVLLPEISKRLGVWLGCEFIGSLSSPPFL